MFSVGAVWLPREHLATSENILGCHGVGEGKGWEVGGWDRCGDCYQHLVDKGSASFNVQDRPHSNDNVIAAPTSVAGQHW